MHAKQRRRLWLNLLLAGLLLMPVTALYAHNLRVFATAEGQWIQGQVYYAGGGAAATARILIYDQQAQLMAELSPDAEGKFRWQAKAPRTYRIVANTGEGHRGEWTIAASELAGAFALEDQVLPAPTAPKSQPQPQPLAAENTASDQASEAIEISCNAVALDAHIEQALARQLRPLREDLARAEDRLALRDLLGGIGWIFGLIGLALWWRSRKA